MVNPDQQMVDNATSALASRNGRMPSKNMGQDGRMAAIARRLAKKPKG